MLSEKQIQSAFASRHNLFITGPAGTGKSYRLNQYIASHENVLVCAPTGIAALNIGGDTMHRVFKIPIPAYEPPNFSKSNKNAVPRSILNMVAEADTVIIDEISMARNDVFRFAIKVIKKAETIKGSKIRIVVCGDFSQLPPVVRKNEASIMEKFDLDPNGYAFTTPEWKSCKFKVVELTEVKRQENADFAHELNKIRIGDIQNLDYWKQFVDPDPDYNNAIVICGTNAEAARINEKYLNELPGNLVALQATVQGKAAAGYVDEIILVKENCKVIFIVNDNETMQYKNGTFGIIKNIRENSIDVEINGKITTVVPHKFSIYAYDCINDELVKKEIGSITQYPFKVGKAITIHKSQGQTFDKVIISPEIFASGQLYVALSRVRAPEGLALLSELKPEYLILNKEVKKFYDDNYTWSSEKKYQRKKTTPKAKKSTIQKSSKKKPSLVKRSPKQTTKRILDRG